MRKDAQHERPFVIQSASIATRKAEKTLQVAVLHLMQYVEDLSGKINQGRELRFHNH